MRLMIIFCFWGMVFWMLPMYSQTSLVKEDVTIVTIPKENLFIHYNTTLLFVGERLYYKIYCVNAGSKQPSSLSKIAYVHLVGEDEKTVFEHKIKLESGMGYGHFLVPPSILSGNYKLIGYTQWMKNDGMASFFQDDIVVINPYSENQEAILANGKYGGLHRSGNQNDSIFSFNGNEEKVPKLKNSKFISATTDSKVYGLKSPVALTLKNNINHNVRGNFSISVRKIDALYFKEQMVSDGLKKLYETSSTKTSSLKSDFYLPELRGELMSGWVARKGDGSRAEGIKVVIYIPGKDGIFQVSSTNEYGRFYFNLQEMYSDTDLTYQILSDESEEYHLEVDDREPLDIESLFFKKIAISTDLKDDILKRSIYNQIENSYVEVKPDSLLLPKTSPPLYRDFEKVYNLDDYSRFPTIEEIIVEIVDNVWFKKSDKGKYRLQVKGYDPFIGSDLLPLVMVDGVFIGDHNDILALNANEIQKISYNRKRLRIGAQVFQGIVAFETINGEYSTPLNKKGTIIKKKITNLFPRYRYFNQKYDVENRASNKRIPDYRRQLLWLPDFQLNNGEKTIEFYTSNLPGDYEISVEGFMIDGKPVSVRKIISVE